MQNVVDELMGAMVAAGVPGVDANAASRNAAMGIREAIAESLGARGRLEGSRYVFREEHVDAAMSDLDALLDIGAYHLEQARGRGAA